MRKTPLKRKSKSLIRKTQDQLWQLCRQIVFLRYGNTCYTCGAVNLEKNNRQCGHMIPDAACGAFLRYDLRILRPQCFHCNINLGGNGAIFVYKMRQIEGNKYVDKIFVDKQRSVKAIDHYLSLIPVYEDIFEQLRNQAKEGTQGIRLQFQGERQGLHTT